MFRIVDGPIDRPLLSPEFSSGALVVFEGRVRNLNEGKAVERLEYEAFKPLAEEEGSRIIEKHLHKIDAAACAHRVGMLEIGEVAIRLEVAAGHRREAFAACSAMIDDIKRNLPIWKKEHYKDGESGWLNCQIPSEDQEGDYYARQIRLPEVGKAGQEKLRQAKVLVVGAGGLGCPALQYLAAAGVGTLGICEPERLDKSNLHRQVLYAEDEVGAPKISIAAARLRRLNSYIRIIEESGALVAANAETLVEQYDIILDCTDNFLTKFLLNDACISLKKALIYASVYQYEGQLFTVQPGGPCLRCLWPIEPPAGCVGNCEEVGILGFVPGVLGTLQAGEAIKRILGMDERSSEMALVDLGSLSVSRIRIRNEPSCPVCGRGTLTQGPWWEVHARSLDDLKNYTLVDVREAGELRKEPLPVKADAWLPMSSSTPEEILSTSEGDILLICHSGVRTAHLAVAFDDAGIKRVYSLVGGLRSLSSLVESKK